MTLFFLITILSGFVLACLTSIILRIFSRLAGWILALLPAGLFTALIWQLPVLKEQQFIAARLPWMPGLGVELSFRLDGFSLLFALIITGIGALVIIYGSGYLKGHPLLARFYAYILMFMASMLGIVLSDNALSMFVFWELTSITSFLLIGFDHEKDTSRQAALHALLVTGTGGLAMLAGLIILSQISGTTTISALNQQADLIQSSPLYVPALILILLGAFAKSAQFPFHFWLPGAMAAPTPVSAYLHSATMVKAGIYLMGRLLPVLGGNPAWQVIVTGVGFATLLTGAVLSIGQKDLKRLLAYSTVAALGTLTMLIGWGSPLAIKSAVVYLLAHALYKGSLFLVAGAIDHETGTRDISLLAGLRRSMPITALAALLAGLSMAGLPPALGFISKELVYETTLSSGNLSAWLTAGAVAANALITAVAGLTALKPFIGPRGDLPASPHEPPPVFWIGPLLLGGLSLLTGLAPYWTASLLIQPAAAAVLNEAIEVKLALWHGLNPMLALSGLTLLLSAAIFLGWRPIWAAMRRIEVLGRYGPAHIYSLSLAGLKRFATWQTRLLQNGYLRVYLMVIILTTVGLAGYALLTRNVTMGSANRGEVRFYEAIISTVILATALLIPRIRSRLATVAALGLIGYGLALIYLLYGAPDLAMIQFAIETLTVILFVLLVYRLPKFTGLTSLPARRWDLLVALSGGVLMLLMTLIVTSRPLVPHISDYFIDNSLPLAYGRNIVNVILVDFRALDTLGEITVLALAAIGVFALIRLTVSRINISFDVDREE